MQSLSCCLPCPRTRFFSKPTFSTQFVSPSNVENRRLRSPSSSRVPLVTGLGRYVVHASGSSSDAVLPPSGNKTRYTPVQKINRAEPFRGKSGSISFHGLSHQVVEEGKLESAPFKDGKGTLLWVLAPVVLLASLLLPQFFLPNVIDSVFKNELIAELLSSCSSDLVFYIGLTTFLLVTDRVQRPYLHFSPKSWGLITGLKGYLSTAFFAMGLKVIAPLLAVYITWPLLRLASVVAVAPFLVGCLAQFALEGYLDKHDSSCWPLVPIVFEIYRLYQSSKALYFIQKQLNKMMADPVTPQALDKNGALIVLIVVFQALGIVCLWSLLTFLMRLFPSRPVSERY